MRAYADLADHFNDLKYDDWVPPTKVSRATVSDERAIRL